MKNNLEIIIQPNGITVCNPSANGIDDFINGQDAAFGERLVRFCANNAISTTSVILYASEELLFFNTFDLPLKTPNLKDAVKLQLGLLIPFTNESVLYNYSTIRKKGSYKVNLYASQTQEIQTFLQKITEAGYKIVGLYPESQRYVNRSRRKERWALLMPGRFFKALVFSGVHMEDRFLCSSEPEFTELTKSCSTEIIYHPQPLPDSRFLDANDLLKKNPRLKEFDLLPTLFRRPDYSKTIILALLILNVVALLGLVGLKEYRLNSMAAEVNTAINQILPQVKEMSQLREQEQKLAENIDQLENLGTTTDLIDFLSRLTENLPATSYLDQLRMDPGGSVVTLQGYTDDISELTSKLQTLGETKLKATSRRRNETYFQLEIGLQ